MKFEGNLIQIPINRTAFPFSSINIKEIDLSKHDGYVKLIMGEQLIKF